MKNIEFKDIQELSKIIDIREENEVQKLSIPGVTNVTMNKLISEPEKHLNQNEEYYIMCASGGRSASTCTILLDKGYNVVNVLGGISAYNNR